MKHKAIRYYRNSMFNKTVISFCGITVGQIKEEPRYIGNEIVINGFAFPKFSQN